MALKLRAAWRQRTFATRGWADHGRCMVVRSSRVMSGLVGRNVELNDDELGFVASDELNPQKAHVLLSLALLKKPTAAQVQSMFRTY